MFRIIGAIGAIQVLTAAVGMVRAKTIAVLLGPEGVGIIGVVDQMVSAVAQLSSFTLSFGALKFLARAHSDGPPAFRRTYAGLLRLLLVLTSSGAAICIGTILLLPDLLGEELAAYRAFLLPALLGVPTITLHGFLAHTLAAAGRARAAALMLLAIAASLALAAYVGTSLAGLAGYYWSSLVACVLIAGGAIAYLRWCLDLPWGGGRHGLREVFLEHPTLVSFGLVLYVSSASSSFGYFVARYTVLSSFGEAEAGLLQAAIVLSGGLSLVLVPAQGLYLTPIVNRAIPVREKMRAALEFQATLVVAIGVLAMPLMLFPHWVLSILFSPAFIGVGHVLFVFVLAQCILLLAAVYQALVIGLDDLKVYAGLIVVGHLSIGGVSWLLAPRHGTLGVAVAFLVANTTIFLLTLARLRWKHGLRLSPRLVVLMVYGLSVLALVGSVGYESRDWPILLVGGKLALYGVFVISLVLFLGRPELRRLQQQLVTRLCRDEQEGATCALGRAYRRLTGRFLPEV